MGAGTFILVLVAGQVVLVDPGYGTKEACETDGRSRIAEKNWAPGIQVQYACVPWKITGNAAILKDYIRQ
jgi:hypothetical protein